MQKQLSKPQKAQESYSSNAWRKKACKFYFEFCENKDLVIGKIKEHKPELLEARNVFINVKIVTK